MRLLCQDESTYGMVHLTPRIELKSARGEARDHQQEAWNPPSVCVLTPRGRGAIGVVRVWGEGALAAASGVFRPARGEGLGATPPRRPRLGRIGAGIGDEVVAVVLDGEPPEVEVQCHGGPAAVELVVEALATAGAVLVEPGAFARHTSASPIRAAAMEDLAKASTLRAAEVLLEQAHGALDAELDRLARGDRDGSSPGARRVGSADRRGGVGVRLISGWRVVIAGRPNVGKSRLLNALAGYQRAIVDATPGTTRDVVTAASAFEGWPVELVDTAGVRGTDDQIERSGIARAHREHRRADLLLKVFDRSQPLETEDHRLLAAEGMRPGGRQQGRSAGGLDAGDGGLGRDRLGRARRRLGGVGPSDRAAIGSIAPRAGRGAAVSGRAGDRASPPFVMRSRVGTSLRR